MRIRGVVSKDRLPMQAWKYWSGFNPNRIHLRCHSISILDQDWKHPINRIHRTLLWRGQDLFVSLTEQSSSTEMDVELLHLCDAQSSLEISHAIVETELLMEISLCACRPLAPEETCLSQEGLLLRDDGATFTTGDDLISVEREDRYIPIE
jgi:hypothetical protein